MKKKQEQEQESRHLPTQYPLVKALDLGTELAVCASMLFIMIVQDRFELGGGYGVQVLALTSSMYEHFDTVEQVEAYLAENTPYTANASVWVPLFGYSSPKHETEFVKKMWEKGE